MSFWWIMDPYIPPCNDWKRKVWSKANGERAVTIGKRDSIGLVPAAGNNSHARQGNGSALSPRLGGCWHSRTPRIEKGMWFRRRASNDFDVEIESHIHLEADRLIAEGMSPEHAQDAARR